jgi:hypothetical protein
MQDKTTIRGATGALLAAACVCTASAHAQAPAPDHNRHRAMLDSAATSPVDARGILTWNALASVKTVRIDNTDNRLGAKFQFRLDPVYSAEVRALGGRKVRLQGFMLPLEASLGEHTHYLVSARPSNCDFCVPGGPESFAEVRAKKGARYTTEPVVVEGRLELLDYTDPTGVYYRLADAQQVELK